MGKKPAAKKPQKAKPVNKPKPKPGAKPAHSKKKADHKDPLDIDSIVASIEKENNEPSWAVRPRVPAKVAVSKAAPAAKASVGKTNVPKAAKKAAPVSPPHPSAAKDISPSRGSPRGESDQKTPQRHREKAPDTHRKSEPDEDSTESESASESESQQSSRKHEKKGSGTEEDFSDVRNERQREYRKGGYHPVSIGELYNDRYRVVQKLGWGYFSTVWLVWDYTDNRFGAMKVQKSAQHYREAAYDEIKLLSEIMENDPENQMCCARLTDYFEHRGPNGTHVCMVFDVLGENLLSLMERYEYKGIPIPIVKAIARQVLIGLLHIHSIEIIHTDLKPENVLLANPKHKIQSKMKRYQAPPIHERPSLLSKDVTTMTKSQRRRFYEKMRKMKKGGPAGPPLETADTAEPEEEPCSETDPEWEVERFHQVCLADFGNSCWTHKQFSDEVQTRQYRSPEVILGCGYSAPIDLWSAACMFFELIVGEFLFDPKEGDTFDRDEDHLAQIMELLGTLPPHMLQGKFAHQFFDSNGRLLHISHLKYWGLEDILHQKYHFSRKKSREIAEFLMPMLVLDPNERATAEDMLKSFDSFFDVQEDDYSPLCFAQQGSDDEADDEEDVETTDDEEEEGEEDEGYNEDDEEEHEEGAVRKAKKRSSKQAAQLEAWHQSQPLLSQQVLEPLGLTIVDVQIVLSGGVLADKKKHQAAVGICERLLGEPDPVHGPGDEDDDDEDDADGEADESSEGEEP